LTTVRALTRRSRKFEPAVMLENIWFIAAFWMGLALLASLISIRVGISVALIEILVGVIVGNIHFGQYHDLLRTTEWTNFLAMLGSGVLTFLAGAEIDPASLRANLRASLSIGALSFLLPFLGSGCSRSSGWAGRCTRRGSLALRFRRRPLRWCMR
jgi:Kef-type K+ transport system membrane component KefB